MKIEIVGSTRDLKGDKIDQKFRVACRAIGAALAKRGHTIVVGIPHWKSPMKDAATAYVIQGANEVVDPQGKKHTVMFYGPWTAEPPDATPGVVDTVDEFKALPNINLVQRPISNSSMNFGANLIPNLNEVDAVILIGGSTGTASIGFAAAALGIPLLTVNSLGGTADAMFQDFLGKKLYLQQEKYKQIDISVLNASWTTEDELQAEPAKKEQQDKKAEAIIALAERLVKINTQEKRRTRLALNWLLFLAPVCVAGWVALYILAAANLLHLTVAFFLLLFIAALIGTSLRTLISQREETAVLTGRSLLIDAVLSILLAFGLALFYLIGGISFTGKVVALNTESSTFQNIALSMSLLGLAAGALIPTRQLMERLEKVVATEPAP